MDDSDILTLYGGVLSGDPHRSSPSPRVASISAAHSGSQSASPTETSSSATAQVSYLRPARHEVVEYHEGDSRLPVRRRI